MNEITASAGTDGAATPTNNPKPIARDLGRHYQWGTICDGWHLVEQEDLSIILERMPPGVAEVPHFHRKTRQFFYVLEGELEIEAGPEIHRVPAATGLEIGPGIAHRVANRCDFFAEFLVVSQPRSHGDRVDL